MQGVFFGPQPALWQHPVDAGQPDGVDVSVARKPRVFRAKFMWRILRGNHVRVLLCRVRLVVLCARLCLVVWRGGTVLGCARTGTMLESRR
jgi:hypothetical protein